MSDTDIFDDDGNYTEESENEETQIEENSTSEETDVNVEVDAEEGEENQTQTGEETEEEPPSSNQEEGNKTEKSIPESRFKAALKDVNDKLESKDKENAALRDELAKLKATPIPDRNTDPDGYDLHTRVEASKSIMRDLCPDYDETILHFNKMAASNPILNQIVAAHPAPAKHAYDIAKRDQEVSEAMAARNSPEWNEFQEWKKKRTTENDITKEVQQQTTQQSKPQKPIDLLSKVPNVNRTTNVKAPSNAQQKEDDGLWAGASF